MDDWYRYSWTEAGRHRGASFKQRWDALELLGWKINGIPVFVIKKETGEYFIVACSVDDDARFKDIGPFDNLDIALITLRMRLD